VSPGYYIRRLPGSRFLLSLALPGFCFCNAISTSMRVDQRNRRMRRICDGASRVEASRGCRSVFCMAASITLPCHHSCYNLPSLLSKARLVMKGPILVGSFWISGFPSHTAVDPAAALCLAHSQYAHTARATGPRSRPSRPNCDHGSWAADVCATRPDA